MTIDEIAAMLEASRQEFAASVSAIPASQGDVPPEPGRWSARECAEHVAIVEERFLGRLSNAPLAAEPRVEAPRESELAAKVVDRSTKAKAPDPAQPSGRFATLEEALQAFHQARSRTTEFARARHADLYLLSVEHARFGPLNGVELMVIMAGHARRHAAQIREVGDSLKAR